MPLWNEKKRRRNIALHGLDFEGTDAIGDSFTVTREDGRDVYDEPRWVTIGVLNGEVVVLVDTERGGDMHVISLRKAEKHEARYYLEIAEDNF